MTYRGKILRSGALVGPRACPPRFLARKALFLAGLVLVAANLRPAVASVSPVLGTIRSDLGLGSAAAGLLTTIPVLCMSVFALVSAHVGERFGKERAVLFSVLLVGAATAARIFGGMAWALFAATLLAGVGIAVAQALLPAIVKERFPERAALVTGLYTVGFNLGAVLPAYATAPLSNLLGSWQDALAVWALLVVPAVVLWLPFARTRAGERQGHEVARLPGGTGMVSRVKEALSSLPWREGRAWLVALWFGANSCIFWSALTWLAPLYVDAGFSERRAGLVLALFTLTQMVAALAVPALADSFEDRRPWFAVSLVAAIAGLLLVGAFPLVGAWAPWAWAVVLGFGVGALFPLALTLPLDNTPDAQAAGRLTSMTFFLGYLMAAFAPVAVGAARDLSGGFSLPFVTLAAVGVAMLAVALTSFGPRRRRAA